MEGDLYEIVSDGAYTEDEVVIDGNNAIVNCTGVDSDGVEVEFEFVFDLQGVWDSSEREYVNKPDDVTFTDSNAEVLAENVEVPQDNGDRYHLSFILSKCMSTDGEVVINY